mgnify:CR=1 FL=1
MTTPDDGLFPVTRAQKRPGGALYQGVCKTIRALEHEGIIDKKLDAGSIAQARALAASIDRLEHAKASGMQLAPMHEQLGKVLERLNPAAAVDEMQQLFEEMDKAMKEDSNRGHAETPHPEV